MGKILYHYCSVDGFFNIIKNATIWLSDVRKSNDYQECILCRDRINAVIEKIMSENEEDLKAWKWGVAHGSELNRDIFTYCACFSESCDQLSQWRGYANNGKGMAIGFDVDLLMELAEADKHSISFAPIIYDMEEQDKYVKEIVEDNFRKLEVKGIGHVGAELNTDYRLKFPFIKNLSFMETINNMLIELYAAMAQAEIEKKEKRQKEGIQAKKERGEWDDYGRPAVMKVEDFAHEYLMVESGELRPFELMRKLGMSKTTFYRYVSRLH